MDSTTTSGEAHTQLQPPGTRSPRRTPSHSWSIHILWQWWSSLTGPANDAFGKGIAAQEQLRRARLISALMLLAIPAIILLILSAISSPLIWIAIFIVSGGCLSVAFFNRAGDIAMGALFTVLLIDGAIASYLLFKTALNPGNLSDFDLFILAVLVGAMILPRPLIPPIGLVQIGLIVGIFFLRPHDALLTQLIQMEGGHVYTLLAGPLVLQVVGTGIAWLHAWSVSRALNRASQAEELAEVRARLSQQASLFEERNRHLEEGIAQILEAHRQISTGNLEARVPMQNDHELWQIGHSLNFLLMRFQQQAQDYQVQRFALQEIEQIVLALLATRNGSPLYLPPCRTTLGLQLLTALGI